MRKPPSHSLSVYHHRHLAFILLHGLFLTSLLQATPLELTALQQIYDQQLTERVTGPYDAGLTQLNTNYSGGLDRAINEAKKAGKLDLIIALEEEKKRLVDKIPLPENDEQTPDELKKLRPIYLTALAKLAEQRAKNHAAFLPAYTKKLQELEVTLTKSDRVEDAKEVKAYREGLVVIGETSAKTVAKAKGPKGDDRKAAELLLRNKCTLTIKTGKGVTLKYVPGANLPKEDFEIVTITQSGPPTPPFTAEDVAVLNNLRSLTHFTLYSTPVGNQVMEALQGSPELYSLYIVNDQSLTDEALAALKHWSKFYSLRLNLCKSITGEGIRITAETRPEIRELRLEDTSVDDSAVPHFLKLKTLEVLHIDSTQITHVGLEKLAGLRNLTELGLSGNSIGKPMDFTIFKKLKTLKITKSVSEPLFQSLGKFPASIEELVIDNIELTEAQLTILASGKGLKKITLNNLKLPPSQLTSFAATAKVEEVIIYAADTSLNDECLMQLSTIKTLKKLSLGKGTTEAGVAAFKKARPDVAVTK